MGIFLSWSPKSVLGYLPCSHLHPLPTSVAQKVVTLRKQQQLLAACKSLPSSPSHSAASTPVAGQVSWGFRVHRRAGKIRGVIGDPRTGTACPRKSWGEAGGNGSDTICRKCIGPESYKVSDIVCNILEQVPQTSQGCQVNYMAKPCEVNFVKSKAL